MSQCEFISCLSVYYFRYYTSSNHLVYLGPLSQNQLLDLGSVNAFVAGAGCQ